jgi:23S rRNA (guanine2445-N2)-methyltransferase / 23S rRNA (guanine2069-N7)-methyltransferase
VDSPDAIYALANSVDWSEHLGADQTLLVDFVGQGRGISNSVFGAQRIKDAIVDDLREENGRRPDVDFENPDLRVNAHLQKGSLTLSLDLAGEALHKRGKGRLSGKAPLKENLAAAILYMADWPRLAAEGAPLFDPMCGSGSFLKEGLGIAQDRAPGLDRQKWGFSHWKGHDPQLWERLRKEALQRSKQGKKRTVRLYGRDTDARALEWTRHNVAQAGGEQMLSLEKGGLELARAPSGSGGEVEGLFVCNPPYGRRLDGVEEAKALHGQIGNTLRRHFLGWKALVITEQGPLTKAVGLRPSQRIPVFNGPIECRVLSYAISREKVARDRKN